MNYAQKTDNRKYKCVFLNKAERAAGTIAYKINPKVRMFEECRLWDISQIIPKQLSYTKFDRTILISGLFNTALLKERLPTTIDNEKK